MGLIKKFRIKSHKKPNSIISFENISLSYGSRLILDNINFKINEGQIFGMLGPNGVGKSTIFNLITGLINPNSGKIKLSNTDVLDYPIYLRTKKFHIGYVPQYGGYFNDLTLYQNLKAIAEIVINDKGNEDYKINSLIAKFELENLKNKSLNCKMITIDNLKDMKGNLLALYPSVGENLDYINSNNLKNIDFLYRKIDQYSWKYCNKGFFNFKNYIPKIVQEFI